MVDIGMQHSRPFPVVTMYITYESKQRDFYLVKKFLLPFFQSSTPTYIIERNTQFSKKLPMMIPKPEYMPSKLVRISDMKLVRGSEVNEGYCTISYSWNQSGEVIPADITGKSKRIDEGKHRIIFPAKTVRQRPRGRKRIPRKVKFVKFEGIIQQIGKDFNIKYIWFDQMCIDQDNPEEKHREIRNMYKTYTNAYCTIALLPELKRIGPILRQEDGKFVWNFHLDIEDIQGSQWIKRLWCLEETLLSSNIILVGRNVSCRWDRLQTDISIFRQPVTLTDKEEYEVPIQKFNYLPSWSGIAGEHSIQHFTTSFKNYTINGRFMQVTCAGLMNHDIQSQKSKTHYRDLLLAPSLPRKEALDTVSAANNNNKRWRLVISARLLSDSTTVKYIRIAHEYTGTLTDHHVHCFAEKLWEIAHFVPIHNDNLFWADDSFFKMSKCASFNFRLTEEFQELSQYVILSGIQFDMEVVNVFCYPVTQYTDYIYSIHVNYSYTKWVSFTAE
ncbi:hypothetical protein BDA99DRAFT_536193 [Phascolomyces articulosus]|uniref:Heterokaryon incompatibility domain-containing protein n=1 Tax=Phascolomyces articulosus TaxID=60185 RepID=A0AAD5PFE6_9FUNG|nr:hypothetical protein BDA99DRAFT_536193 [Phascolomyces articulosus]